MSYKISFGGAKDVYDFNFLISRHKSQFWIRFCFSSSVILSSDSRNTEIEHDVIKVRDKLSTITNLYRQKNYKKHNKKVLFVKFRSFFASFKSWNLTLWTSRESWLAIEWREKKQSKMSARFFLVWKINFSSARSNQLPANFSSHSKSTRRKRIKSLNHGNWWGEDLNVREESFFFLLYVYFLSFAVCGIK